uniref:G_PROTEIN_RECEP_F1_2 domain-containing protein n=1 Tax=Caenorhabditis tropicalis TaxID=1561998 RepID=A0A1I7TWF7_9PELO
MLPTKPPKYTPRLPEYVPIHYRVYHPDKQETPATRQSEEADILLSRQERCFLMMFTILALFSLLTNASALMLDKHAITGTFTDPSTCLLTDSRDCRTVYTSEVVRKMVEVAVRVDLLLSCVAFTTGVVLLAFKIFNGRLLIGFLLMGIAKSLFINTALLLILTNTAFYFNTIVNTLSGMCGHQFCWEDETANIVVAFVLLTISAITTFAMTLNVFVLGSHILRKYDEAHNEMLWAKWDAMAAELVSF